MKNEISRRSALYAGAALLGAMKTTRAEPSPAKLKVAIFLEASLVSAWQRIAGSGRKDRF